MSGGVGGCGGEGRQGFVWESRFLMSRKLLLLFQRLQFNQPWQFTIYRIFFEFKYIILVQTTSICCLDQNKTKGILPKTVIYLYRDLKINYLKRVRDQSAQHDLRSTYTSFRVPYRCCFLAQHLQWSYYSLPIIHQNH